MTEMSVLKREPIAAEESEHQLLGELDEFLSVGPESSLAPVVVGRDGFAIALPDSALRLLHEIVHFLAQGRVVTVVPADKELTTQQAADILNISRPYLVKMLDRGDIPFSKTGAHRRVRFDDIMSYKRRRDADRAGGLRALTQLSEELGLYDLPSAGAEQ